MYLSPVAGALRQEGDIKSDHPVAGPCRRGVFSVDTAIHYSNHTSEVFPRFYKILSFVKKGVIQ
jgi:hypothetical protein